MADDKKIIIDEDWKSQVEAEKEAAKQPPSPTGTIRQRPTVRAGDSDDFQMPPASLEMLVSTLVTEAMIALGQMPHPATGQDGNPTQSGQVSDRHDRRPQREDQGQRLGRRRAGLHKSAPSTADGLRRANRTNDEARISLIGDWCLVLRHPVPPPASPILFKSTVPSWTTPSASPANELFKRDLHFPAG